MTRVSNAELAVVLGTDTSPAEKRVVELLAERIRERSGVAVAGPADAVRLRLVIGTLSSNDRIRGLVATCKEITQLGSDGYCIVAGARKPDLYVVGQSASGVVAGVGRLMREIRYRQGKLELPDLTITEAPRMPNRGMYLWARKYYFSEPEKVDRYIEEFALWGGDAICFWFGDPRKILWMVYRHHERGYQRLRIATGLSPSGVHWRCNVAPAKDFLREDGALKRDSDSLVARYSSANGDQYFGWPDAAELTPDQMADLFVERFPDIAAAGLGPDWCYAGWYQDMLRMTEPDGLPFAYSDGFNDGIDGLPWLSAITSRAAPVPRPPPGETESE